MRIIHAHDHAGHLTPHGVYCSRGCAEVANPGNGAADAAADTNIRRRIAATVDPRLPSVIMWLADGETQQEVADRLKISPQAVSQLIKRLRVKSTCVPICER
jgi:DNA-binding NarL/FixJ family response regulator